MRADRVRGRCPRLRWSRPLAWSAGGPGRRSEPFSGQALAAAPGTHGPGQWRSSPKAAASQTNRRQERRYAHHADGNRLGNRDGQTMWRGVRRGDEAAVSAWSKPFDRVVLSVGCIHVPNRIKRDPHRLVQSCCEGAPHATPAEDRSDVGLTPPDDVRRGIGPDSAAKFGYSRCRLTAQPKPHRANTNAIVVMPGSGIEDTVKSSKTYVEFALGYH